MRIGQRHDVQCASIVSPPPPCPCLRAPMVINRVFMKMFKTTDMSVVKYCQHEFNFDIPKYLGR